MVKMSSFYIMLPIIFLVCAPRYAKDAVADPEFDEMLSKDITGLSITSVATRFQQL